MRCFRLHREDFLLGRLSREATARPKYPKPDLGEASMNAERLHAILRNILEDLQKTNLENTLKELIDHLQQQVNQPSQPQPQQQVSKTLTLLNDSLERAPSNDFPPTWRQLLEEMSCDEYLGNKVRDKIEAIFSRNQITPSIALDEIRQIYAEVQKLGQAINNIIPGFDYLKIGSDDLEPGECELGILIPRAFVEDKLRNFGDELVELDKILKVFDEISIGSRPGFEIREISSSDLSVFLGLDPITATSLVFAVERIIALYKNVLEIRKIHNDLKDHKVPKKNLKGIKDYVSSIMEKGIDDLVPKIIKQFCISQDGCRTNELKIDLTLALKKIANRIDSGFNIEIRAQPTPEDSETNSGDEESRQRIEAIQSAAKTLQFLKTEGEPILSLPESIQTKKKKTPLRKKSKPSTGAKAQKP